MVQTTLETRKYEEIFLWLTSPVRSSHSTIPKLKTSALWLYGLCSITFNSQKSTMSVWISDNNQLCNELAYLRSHPSVRSSLCSHDSGFSLHSSHPEISNLNNLLKRHFYWMKRDKPETNQYPHKLSRCFTAWNKGDIFCKRMLRMMLFRRFHETKDFRALNWQRQKCTDFSTSSTEDYSIKYIFLCIFYVYLCYRIHYF